MCNVERINELPSDGLLLSSKQANKASDLIANVISDENFEKYTEVPDNLWKSSAHIDEVGVEKFLRIKAGVWRMRRARKWENITINALEP